MKIDREYAPRVKEPAYGVVDRLRGGERLVTALVRDDPETGSEETSPKAVQRPDSETGSGVLWWTPA